MTGLLLFLLLLNPQKLNDHPLVTESVASKTQHGGWSEWRCAACELTDAAIVMGDRWVWDSSGCVISSCGHSVHIIPPKQHRWETMPVIVITTTTAGTIWMNDEPIQTVEPKAKPRYEIEICLEHGETRVREWEQ